MAKDILAIELHFRWMRFESIEPDILLFSAPQWTVLFFERANEPSLHEAPSRLAKASIGGRSDRVARKRGKTYETLEEKEKRKCSGDRRVSSRESNAIEPTSYRPVEAVGRHVASAGRLMRRTTPVGESSPPPCGPCCQARSASRNRVESRPQDTDTSTFPRQFRSAGSTPLVHSCATLVRTRFAAHVLLQRTPHTDDVSSL